MKTLLLTTALVAAAGTAHAEAHTQPTPDLDGSQTPIGSGPPEEQAALVVGCGLLAFAVVAGGAVTGPYVGALVPLFPAACYVWDEFGRPDRGIVGEDR